MPPARPRKSSLTSVAIYQPSKLDLERMSLSNNLSEIHTSKPEEVNIYAKTPLPRADAQRTSGASGRRTSEARPFPVSDPEFSSKKLGKNQKMKTYLEKFAQNASNKSFISLQENRELFSRKNSSMHDSGCAKSKALLGSAKLGGQVKLRLVQKGGPDPKSFRFSDMLEERRSLNVAIPEYPNGSGARGASFQSSKSVEQLLHGAALTNTKKTSFLGEAARASPSARLGPSFLGQFDRTCSELLQDLLEEGCRDRLREQRESRAAQEQQRRRWGRHARRFERQTREFLSSKEFPWKVSSDEVKEFLEHFAEFLCSSKLDVLVGNINLGPSSAP